jgi:hypothetical protein
MWHGWHPARVPVGSSCELPLARHDRVGAARPIPSGAGAEAAHPPSVVAEAALQRLLSDELGLAPDALRRLLPAAAPHWAAAAAGGGGEAGALRELSLGFDALAAAGLSRPEAARLLLAQPALVAAPVQSWMGFLEGIGLTPAQRRNAVIACPEVRPARWLRRRRRMRRPLGRDGAAA